MHVSGTLLLTQEGRDGLQRQLQWVLMHPGSGPLGRACLCARGQSSSTSQLHGWQQGAGAHHHNCFIWQNCSHQVAIVTHSSIYKQIDRR